MTQTVPSAPRLLLIDGHSVAYRAFFALPVENFSTSTGQHTNAVYGFTSMLINVLRDEQPTHVAVAFDLSRQTFRSERYSDYKANRSASPEEFTGQVALIREVLDALRIPHLDKEGFEADDIIATLSLQAGQQGFDTLIVTGDRDAMQLVDAHTTVLYPRKGVSDLLRLDPALVEERYLVPPTRYPELAALVGETSDNLPGVPGVGPKTAAKWLTEYDGLENLLAHADAVRGKAGESFRAHLDDVTRNRELNALVRTLELPQGPADFARVDWDREAVHTLFDALEFRVLRERLLETLPAQETEPEGGFEVAGVALAGGDLPGWLDEHGGGLVGLQPEGRWGAGAGDLSGVALASLDGAAAWLDVATITPEDDAVFASWLASETSPKAMHDAKGPLEAIWARGWELGGLTSDTHLAAYLLRPDQRTYDLADLTARHLRRELTVEGAAAVDDGQLTLDFADPEAGRDAMLRARAVAELAGVLDAELGEAGGASLLGEVELPLQRTLARMEQVGIALDSDALERLWADFDTEVRRAEQEAYDAIGKPINLGSP
ncbi:MAG: 5'-3' exonuclease H3TH domain-containing protein, partial [Propioniciclava sp.]